MKDITRVQLLVWDGSVESFNNIVDLLFPRERVQISFLDEDNEWTNKFTNKFQTIFLLCGNPSKYNYQYDMIFKVGYTFSYELPDNK